MKDFNLNEETQEVLILKEKLEKNIKELQRHGISLEEILKELGGTFNE